MSFNIVPIDIYPTIFSYITCRTDYVALRKVNKALSLINCPYLPLYEIKMCEDVVTTLRYIEETDLGSVDIINGIGKGKMTKREYKEITSETSLSDIYKQYNIPSHRYIDGLFKYCSAEYDSLVNNGHLLFRVHETDVVLNDNNDVVDLFTDQFNKSNIHRVNDTLYTKYYQEESLNLTNNTIIKANENFRHLIWRPEVYIKRGLDRYYLHTDKHMFVMIYLNMYHTLRRNGDRRKLQNIFNFTKSETELIFNMCGPLFVIMIKDKSVFLDRLSDTSQEILNNTMDMYDYKLVNDCLTVIGYRDTHKDKILQKSHAIFNYDDYAKLTINDTKYSISYEAYRPTRFFSEAAAYKLSSDKYNMIKYKNCLYDYINMINKVLLDYDYILCIDS